MQGKKVLLAAADLIERDGWVQGTMFEGEANDENVRRCAVGAIYKACADHSRNYQAGLIDSIQYTENCDHYYRTRLQHKVEAAIRELHTPRGRKMDPYGLTLWNDAPSRKKSEVVALLRKAAEL
jgi:hypothetical protein